MQIIYKCRCMKNERTIVVTDRIKDTDIGDWMSSVVQPCLSYDHRNNSPLCVADKVDYLKIHVDQGQEQVGVPMVKN